MSAIMIDVEDVPPDVLRLMADCVDRNIDGVKLLEMEPGASAEIAKGAGLSEAHTRLQCIGCPTTSNTIKPRARSWTMQSIRRSSHEHHG